MGQRHQAYIIARVIPHGSTAENPVYRSLGGWHHQWCYGSLPLRAALRMISLLKNPVNASIVSAEVDALHNKEINDEFPCPYTHFLLASAFDFDLETNYHHGSYLPNCLHPASFGCWDGDNNDGLTIIDVTNPLNPAYAFVMGDETDPGLGDLPVCAEDYIRAYYPVANLQDEKDIEVDEERKALIAQFDDIPFLTEDLLAEAWPDEFGPNKQTSYRRHRTRKAIIPKILAAATVENKAAENVSVASLADLTIGSAVLQSLELSDTTDLELMLPAKAAQIRQALCTLDPFPDTGIPLLSKVVEGSTTVDLSGSALSTSQLRSLASTLPETRLEAVILSRCPKITTDHVRILLENRPNINRIELLGTDIGSKDLHDLVKTSPDLFKRVSDILHPLCWTNNDTTHPGAFHLLLQEPNKIFRNGAGDAGNLAMLVWTPDKVVRNIIDLLAAFQNPAAYRGLLGVATQACFSTGSREGQPASGGWGQRPVTALLDDMTEVCEKSWIFGCRKVPGDRLKNNFDPKYGFLRLISKDPVKIDVYSLSDFLKEMKKEGRGPLPPDDVVNRFETALIMSDSQETQTDNVGPGLMSALPLLQDWSLFDSEEATQFYLDFKKE